MRALAYLWQRQRLALLAFAAATVLAVLFALRLVVFWFHWSDPALRDVTIEGWMTPGYVAHSYRVPPQVIFDAIAASARPGHRQTLDEIARDAGVPRDALIAAILAVIASEREGR